MAKRNHAHQDESPDDLSELQHRLQETEETLQAIRQYMVDAFVVHRDTGIQVVTLNESEIPYRMMVESMNEGAITLIPDGTIFYCNPCFSEMIQRDCEKLVGTLFHELIKSEERAKFIEILQEAGGKGIREEFNLQSAEGSFVPVQLSMYLLGEEEEKGIAVLATDISERIRSEAKIRNLASKLSLAEQEERRRLSEVLHDDLQQRLFAVKAQLSFLHDFFESDQVSAEVYSELGQIQESLSEVITITRNLSIDLNPVVLQGEGLAEAMTWLSFRMKEQHGLHIDLEAKEKFSYLDPQMRMLLFQSVRELLFNVVKHAGVSEAKIILDQTTTGRGRIHVSDGGKGFDAERMMNDMNTAHGLLVVRDRLTLMDCRMEVVSSPSKGTHVHIDFPVEGAPA